MRKEAVLFQRRFALFVALALVLLACNFASLVGAPSPPPPETQEIQATPDEDATEDEEIAPARAVVQVPPTLAPEPTPLPPAAVAEADAEELLLINLYERVNPSVVNILVTVGQKDDELPIPGGGLFPTQGQGSGFIYDTQGHIVTNNHVVAEAVNVKVTFHDGSTVEAEVVGSDLDSDLAIVQVEVPPESLRPVVWGNSDELRVGQRAVAIGNPFGLDGTLTSGIISALGRSLPAEQNTRYVIPEIIQTDAAINPGNSGGPLLNSQGEVIGVNTAIVPNRQGFGERSFLGVGFAIPSNLVRRVVEGLVQDGAYRHPWIGFSGTTVTPEIATLMELPQVNGALVDEVISGSPADKAGLRSGTRPQTLENGSTVHLGGDVIIAIEDEEVRVFEDLLSFLSRRGEVGQTVTLKIIRDGQEQMLPLTLGPRPKMNEVD